MTDLSRRLSLIALLGILCAGALPQSGEQSTAMPEKLARETSSVKGVAGFSEVTPHLYRGGQPSKQGLESLAKMGIDIVVDGRLTGARKEGKAVTKMGMQFVALPWHCLYPRDEVFARFLAVVRDNPGKNIFVHCRYGDDRTGMMIAAYRMAVQGWTWQEAREEMNKFGFHHKVCASLVWYEKQFPQRLKGPAFRGLSSTPQTQHSDRENPPSTTSGPSSPAPAPETQPPSKPQI